MDGETNGRMQSIKQPASTLKLNAPDTLID